MKYNNKVSRIISIVSIIVLIMALTGCKQEQDTTDVPVQVQPPEIDEQPVQQPVEPTPAPDLEEKTPEEIKEEVISKADDTEKFSGLRCDESGIQSWVKNIDNMTHEIGKTLRVVVNGYPVYPPTCEKLKLEPGETTYCSDLTGPYDFKKGTNKVVINYRSESKQQIVECNIT